jgi:hypothetical protein
MLAVLSEFTKVQSLKTDNTNYTVGKTIKFWHLDERNWAMKRQKSQSNFALNKLEDVETSSWLRHR